LNQNGQTTLRIGTSTKGFLVNINSAIDPSAYKEIGTKNCWINNSLEIWKCLTVSSGLKTEIGYSNTKIN
jgi:hypothetical protein